MIVRPYSNSVPTPQGGSHEQGLRGALTKALRAHGERVGAKKAKDVTADDVMEGACIMLSCFIPNPQFQGQTKERPGMPEATRIVAPGEIGPEEVVTPGIFVDAVVEVSAPQQEEDLIRAGAVYA